MFTGEKVIFVPIPVNATAQDIFKLYITEQVIDHTVI